MNKKLGFRAFGNVLTTIVGLNLLLFSCAKYDEKPVKPPPQQPGTGKPAQPGTNPPPSASTDCTANFQYGYTDKVSYYQDEPITVFAQASGAVDLCRLQIYDSHGVVVFSVDTPLKVQTMSPDEPYRNGFGFKPTVEFNMPARTQSGVYLIENKIPFIIKTRDAVDVMVVYPSNTANAYSDSGGKSLYTTPVTERPPIVSFHRPIDLQSFTSECVSWLSQLNKFKIGYLADCDLDSYENFSNSKALVLIGHSEYWSRKGRKNFDQYINNGKHALILSGNTMWWQVRYSEDGSQLICYKNQKLDPETNILIKTEYWANPVLQYPIFSSICADSDEGGYGLRTDQGWDGYKIASPDSPLLEGTNLKRGDIISVPTAEYDGTLLKGFDADGYPIPDQDALNVSRIELIGYDIGFRGKTTYGTFIVFQRTNTSGIVINTASTDWCSFNGMGGTSASAIKKITLNAITKLVNGDEVFSK